MRQKVVIIGAAGRDFHNFNVYFRDNDDYDVVAFTANQIPNIENRVYPPVLAGRNYPKGIPILPESELESVIQAESVDLAVFSYSDVAHEQVMQVGARALSAGAGFLFLSPQQTMLESRIPVVAVCAVRTGSGKSQTSRYIAGILSKAGKRVVVVRHPMPYGDLSRQIVQRFATMSDLDLHETTIEEREEYEPHIASGRIVYAGVDYEAILRDAEKDADVIIWDGGNNDFSFYRPDLLFVVLDPHRADHSQKYYPSEVNVRLADVLIINKVDTASADQIETATAIAREVNRRADVITTSSPVRVENGEMIRGKRVLVVEDGPTLTHGGMSFGAGTIAAKRFGAAELIDPRPFAVGSIQSTFEKYPTTGPILPAMGYGEEQVRDLEETIRRTPADLVLIATPIDLTRVLTIDQPFLRVRYDLEEVAGPTLESLLAPYLS